jgi:hypothetical protein
VEESAGIGVGVSRFRSSTLVIVNLIVIAIGGVTSAINDDEVDDDE